MQTEGRAPIAKSPTRDRLWFLAVGAAVFAADQITKGLALDLLGDGRTVDVIGEILRFRLSFNPGGAFGLLQGAPLLFFVASSVIVVMVAVWAWRGTAPFWTLGLIFGGGLGNLFDRLTRPPAAFFGEVVDFIQLPYWPTFNIADSAIVIGVVSLIVQSMREGDR